MKFYFSFGAYVYSDELGITYNDQMDDFSIPLAESDGLLPAPANFIAPKKSPMSSMSPIIVLDQNKDVQLVLGGAGGILIMSETLKLNFLRNFVKFNQIYYFSFNCSVSILLSLFESTTKGNCRAEATASSIDTYEDNV